jgi:hypothetical protein
MQNFKRIEHALAVKNDHIFPELTGILMCEFSAEYFERHT